MAYGNLRFVDPGFYFEVHRFRKLFS